MQLRLKSTGFHWKTAQDRLQYRPGLVSHIDAWNFWQISIQHDSFGSSAEPKNLPEDGWSPGSAVLSSENASKQGNRPYCTVQPPVMEGVNLFGDHHRPGQVNQSLLSFGKVENGALEAGNGIQSRTRGRFFGNNHSSGQANSFGASFGNNRSSKLGACALSDRTETVDRLFGTGKQTPSELGEIQDGSATPAVFLPVILLEIGPQSPRCWTSSDRLQLRLQMGTGSKTSTILRNNFNDEMSIAYPRN